MYTPDQEELLIHIKSIVQKIEEENPLIGHEFDHIRRVVKWIKIIAKKEDAKNPFLCELAGWLHDIGHSRTNLEKNLLNKRHHEHSYEMLKEWFKEDKKFDILTEEEKIELLYAIRYHWNDAANDYDTAWILRDADKIDMLGEEGMERSLRAFEGDDRRIDMELRFKMSVLYWIKTDTARQIIKDKDLIKPIEEYAINILKKGIKPIEL